MRKRIALLLLAALLWAVCCPPGMAEESLLERFNQPSVTICVPTGASAMTAAEERFPNATFSYPANELDGYLEVEAGRVDAFVHDDLSVRYAAASHESLVMFPETFGSTEIAIGISKQRSELKPLIDAFIEGMLADGSMDALISRWADSLEVQLPEYVEPENPVGTLRVGTSGLSAPATFYGESGGITGSDIELTYLLCQALNMKLEFSVMPYDAMVLALQSGKLDIVVANLNITPERAELIDYSVPYRHATTALLVKAGGPHDIAATQPAAQPADPLADRESMIAYIDGGKRVGVVTGTTFDAMATELFPHAEKVYVTAQDEAANAVLLGKMDCYLTDLPQAIAATALQPELWYSPALLADDYYGAVFAKGQEALRDQFDAWMAPLKADGTLKALQDKWLWGDPETIEMPEYTLTGENGTFKVAAKTGVMPFVYQRNGKVVGYETELMMRFCQENGYQLVLNPSSHEAALLSVSSGKVDMVIGCVSITEERKERMLFSQSVYDGGVAVVFSAKAREQAMAEAAPASGEPAQTAGALDTLEKLQAYVGTEKHIGINTGSVYDQMTAELFPGAPTSYIEAQSELVTALTANKIDGFLIDKPVADSILYQQPTLWYSPVMLSEDQYGVCFSKTEEALRDEFNAWLATVLADGRAAALQAKWLEADATAVQADAYAHSGEKGKLAIGYATDSYPFTFMSDGAAAGYEVELLDLFCSECGYEPDWQPNTFTSALAGVASDKLDISIGAVFITDERKETMLFSEPDYLGGGVMMFRRADYEAELIAMAGLTYVDGTPTAPDAPTETFFESIAASFERTFVREQRWKMLLQGLLTTLLISVLSAIFGTLIGFGTCMARRSKNGFLCGLAKAFVRLVQGTPIVVLLMILYYLVFGDVSAVFVAVVGFSVNFGAYVSEMMRTGIEAVDRGQQEAAAALGFTRSQAFFRIIFPQAARHFLPVYRGEFISMVKMTSVVGYITIQDLTRMSDIIRSRTYEAFFPLITTAILYFLLAWVLTLALGVLEKRLDPARRSRTVKGVRPQ